MIRLIGYGNPARGDDGLGPAFADWAEEAGFDGLFVRSAFQLVVDDALWIRDAAVVVFADATVSCEGPYRFRPAVPDPAAPLGTHAASPETVLALAQILYGATPQAFVMEIAGAEFGTIHEGLSAQATANLRAATAFFSRWTGQRAAAAVP